MGKFATGARVFAVIFSVVSSLLLAGCASVAQIDTIFDEEMQQQAARQLEPGDARIKGEAFLRPGTWRSLKAAGELIWLTPATPYADERIRKIYGSGKFVPAMGATTAPRNDAYSALMRTTKADTEGKFVFENVKAGRYYLTCMIAWHYADDDLWQGGAVMEEVTVKPGETVKVILSGH